MISRQSARIISEVYQKEFISYHTNRVGGTYGRTYTSVRTNNDELYDFLYDHDYPLWLLMQIEKLSDGKRAIKEWIMGYHTGESLVQATKEWTWEQRNKLGQQYLEELAEDMMNRLSKVTDTSALKEAREAIDTLNRHLRLDGYEFHNGTLLRPESDVLDVQEEKGILHNLFTTVGLGNAETAFHHLSLSEEHYLAGRWDDSISNSRKFFESVMQEVAIAHSSRVNGQPLSDQTYTRPVAVRDYLEREGLIETKEKEAIAKVYGLLSHTGGHPYMAQDDQARLLRHLALTLSQFVMLRLKGVLVMFTNATAQEE